MLLCKPTAHTCGECYASAGLIALEDPVELWGILKGLTRMIKGVKGWVDQHSSVSKGCLWRGYDGSFRRWVWTHFSLSLLIKGPRPPNGSSGCQAQNTVRNWSSREQNRLPSLWLWGFNLLKQFPGFWPIYSVVTASSEGCPQGFGSSTLSSLHERNPFEWRRTDRAWRAEVALLIVLQWTKPVQLLRKAFWWEYPVKSKTVTNHHAQLSLVAGVSGLLLVYQNVCGSKS